MEAAFPRIRAHGLVAAMGVSVFLAAMGMIGCAPVGAGAARYQSLSVVLNERALQPGVVWNGDASLLKVQPRDPASEPSFDDPRSVLRFIMAAAPERAVVYPTERYYYYTFPLGPRVVSGNIRFADVEDGEFSVGYFDAYSQREMMVGHFKDSKDGVSMHYNPETGEVSLSLDGLSRIFVLDRSALEPPGFPLLPGEAHVTGVRDESGYFLQLLYYKPGRAFYYVLDDRKPRPERWIRGDSTKVEAWFGERSRFCFVRHAPTGRYILVGVSRREIAQNTWYDGPFDQVPPRLPLRAMLEEAYPYVEDAGGLDEHGNFLELEGQRVAISPYRAYESGAQLEKDLEGMMTDAADPTAWTTATYESKRDWRAPKEGEQAGMHLREFSLGWPANHWGASSRGWGKGHEVTLSQRWPVNHDAAVSRLTEPSE